MLINKSTDFRILILRFCQFYWQMTWRRRRKCWNWPVNMWLSTQFWTSIGPDLSQLKWLAKCRKSTKFNY